MFALSIELADGDESLAIASNFRTFPFANLVHINTSAQLHLYFERPGSLSDSPKGFVRNSTGEQSTPVTISLHSFVDVSLHAFVEVVIINVWNCTRHNWPGFSSPSESTDCTEMAFSA